MKKQLPILAFLLIASIDSSAQITFQKIYGGAVYDIGYSVQQTTDGGYVIVGTTNSFGAGNYDIYLLKTDAYGNLQWSKTFGGAGYDGSAVLSDPYSVQQTNDGGYVITGHTDSFGAGGIDVYLLRTDANGNLLWSKTFGGTLNDYGAEVRQTTDGGYVIAGRTRSFGNGWYAYLVKTDAIGNLTWTKAFGGTFGGFMGFDVQQTADGGYILTGAQTTDSIGYRDVSLVKTDSAGNLLWLKTFGGIYSEEGHSIQQTADGGYVIGGLTNSFGSGGWDVYLLRTDSAGSLLWSKTFGGALYDWGYSVQLTAGGGIMIAGTSESFGGGYYDYYLLKTDDSGNLIWSRTFGSTTSDFGCFARQTTDGGYVLAGTGMSFFPKIYLVKTDSSGYSGCNESNPASITTVPVTVTTTPAVLNSSGGAVSNPATVTGNGGTDTTLCFVTAIYEQETGTDITVYPVPATTELRIKNAEFRIGEIEIYDAHGQKVLTKKATNEKQLTINVSSLTPGIYFVKGFHAGKYYRKKIIIG
ncbi:MAG TPA: T9SS type A sorting domain-containing protein [Bacteroidia bacterium]|nr:T9SS type A sorting domain-containing protein [Bacteroidia bacterium]